MWNLATGGAGVPRSRRGARTAHAPPTYRLLLSRGAHPPRRSPHEPEQLVRVAVVR